MPKTLGDLIQNKTTGFSESQNTYRKNPIKEYTLQDLRDDEEFNDVSERSYQFDRGGQWIKGKSAPTFAPISKIILTEFNIFFTEH